MSRSRVCRFGGVSEVFLCGGFFFFVAGRGGVFVFGAASVRSSRLVGVVGAAKVLFRGGRGPFGVCGCYGGKGDFWGWTRSNKFVVLLRGDVCFGKGLILRIPFLPSGALVFCRVALGVGEVVRKIALLIVTMVFKWGVGGAWGVWVGCGVTAIFSYSDICCVRSGVERREG